MADMEVPTATPEATAPQPQAQAPAQLVNVIDPDTQEMGSIPVHQLQEAISQGYQQATPEQVHLHLRNEKYGGLGQQAKTAAEGALEGATFGLSTGVETGLGIAEPEDIRGRREENPISHMVGQGAGIAASGLLAPEVSAAKALGAAGEGAAALTGLAGETALSKIGSAAVKGAVETALVQGGDEVSKMFAGDPDQSVETVATNIGLAGILGAGISGGIGAISPLWNATMGGKVGQILKAVQDRAGGLDGAVPDAIHEAVQTSGLNIPAEVKAGLSSDPMFQQMFKTLEQSDTTKSGLELQETFKNFKKEASNSLVQSLGRNPEELSGIENLSKYEAGKKLGNQLADELNQRVGPLAEKFDKIKEKYQDVELTPDRPIYGQQKNPYLSGNDAQISAPSRSVVPGTTSKIADEISQLVQKEGWYSSPSSDIMGEVNRVLREVPELKTLKDLSNYQTQLGANTYDFTNPLLSRAGQLMKGILRDAESEVVSQKLTAEAPELLGEHQAARKAWKEASDLKELLNDRLHVGGGNSPTSFIKNLREMATTDGERIIQRLSGKNDAATLQLLKSTFPKTAQALQEFHINDLLKTAASKAQPGEAINATALATAIQKMSPELKNFAISPEALKRVESIGTVLDEFKKVPHNFSNTARTMDKLSSYIPGSAVAIATMLTGHNPALALVLGPLVKYIGKDVPDAVRLAMLKFVGSNQPLESQGFKSMVDFIQHTIEGQNLINKSAKNIFKAGALVLPEALLPSEKDRTKLDKQLKLLQEDPQPLLNIGGKTAQYLPEQGQALGTLAANATNFLNSLRPQTEKRNPLDSERKPSVIEKSQYAQALDIAQQPLVVLNKIKEGTLTPRDIQIQQKLYPKLFQQLQQKLTEQMVETVSKGDTIPYKTRLSLSMYLGQPLDSTMTPMGLQMLQMKGQVPSQQNQAQQMHPKHSMQALNKLAPSYATAGQAREQQKLSP